MKLKKDVYALRYRLATALALVTVIIWLYGNGMEAKPSIKEQFKERMLEDYGDKTFSIKNQTVNVSSGSRTHNNGPKPLESIMKLPYEVRNNTPTNTNLVFYNRMPKCGSTTMLNLMKELAELNSFLYDSRDGEYEHFTEEKQKRFMKKLNQTRQPSVYIQHVKFMNFSKINASFPAYMNYIRDPVKREISAFYYVRSPDHQISLRNRGFKKRPQEWLNLNINEAIMNQKDMFELLQKGKRRAGIVYYFCGYHSFCGEPLL